MRVLLHVMMTDENDQNKEDIPDTCHYSQFVLHLQEQMVKSTVMYAEI